MIIISLELSATVGQGGGAAGAREVESALIDYIGLSDLDNLVAGHNMDIRGRMSAAEIAAIYEAPAIVTEPVLLIIINKAAVLPPT